MAKLFWTGKLSWPMAVLANANNILAFLTGRARNSRAMTERVKQGYDGVFSDHVRRYDELGYGLQRRAAQAELEEVDLRGKTVLDVGGGTGAISFLALERGAAQVTCGDISVFMLAQAKARASSLGYGPDRFSLKELDAQALPYPDDAFDVVLTGMTLGVIPEQKKAVTEMVRVCRPGGLVIVGAHGPEHYWEPVDECFRSIPKRYVLGYRLEYWPQSERAVRKLMESLGLEGLLFKRVIWRNRFPTGGDAFDFFLAISAAWWHASFPPSKIAPAVEKMRRSFMRRNAVRVTDDVIFGYGRKPQVWAGRSK